MRHWNDAVVVPQLFSPHTCNVSLDNILGGKRSRRTTTAELGVSSPKKTPKNPRTPRSRSETPAGSFSFFSLWIEGYLSLLDCYLSYTSCARTNT